MRNLISHFGIMVSKQPEIPTNLMTIAVHVTQDFFE